MKVHEHYGCGGPYGQAKDFLASLECEIEAVKNNTKAEKVNSFKAVADGSLRNGGVEYCSAVPLPRKALVESFTNLHASLSLGKEPFSERTSTHVHINMSNVDDTHARQMVLLYALFEEFFFALVKPCRRDNIHCVPLTETYLPEKYKLNLWGLEQCWHKYTALNLKRLHDLGTFEFRHLHGTNDPVELNTWLHVLENLWRLSQRVSVNQATLADKNVIMEWFEFLFFPSDQIMKLKPSMHNIIKNSLIDVKLSTLPA